MKTDKNTKSKISPKVTETAQRQNTHKPTVGAAQQAEKEATDKFSTINIFILIIAGGFLASVFYHYYQINVLQKDFYPFNTFLFLQTDRFNDFANIYDASHDLDPFTHSVSVYFPLAYQMMFPFTLLSHQTALFLFLASFVAFFIYFLYSWLGDTAHSRKLLLIIICFLSYPMLFLLDRANLEAWMFMSMAGFLIAYKKEKHLLSALFLSVGISLKVYPALFGIIFLIDKKYLNIVYVVVFTAVLTLLSAALLKGGIIASYHGQSACLNAFKAQNLFGGTGALQHSSSLFVPLKLLYYQFYTSMGRFPLGFEKVFNNWYVILCGLVFLVNFYILLRYKMQLWRSVSILTIMFIILPQISYDYKLIDLFIPVVLFISAREEGKSIRRYAVLLALLLIPKDYLIIADDLSISSVLNPLIMVSINILLVVDAIKNGEKAKILSFGK